VTRDGRSFATESSQCALQLQTLFRFDLEDLAIDNALAHLGDGRANVVVIGVCEVLSYLNPP
jgi:hypothetical protein